MRGRLRWGLLWGLTEMAIPFSLIPFGEQHVVVVAGGDPDRLGAAHGRAAGHPARSGRAGARHAAGRARGRPRRRRGADGHRRRRLVGRDARRRRDPPRDPLLRGRPLHAARAARGNRHDRGRHRGDGVRRARADPARAHRPAGRDALAERPPPSSCSASRAPPPRSCCFAILVAEVGGGRAIVITYVSPVVAVALGVTVLGESLGAGAVPGLLLILAGSWLATDGRLPPGWARRCGRSGAAPVRGPRAARGARRRRCSHRPHGRLTPHRIDIAGEEVLDELRPLWLALKRHHGAMAPAEGPVRDDDEGWGHRRSLYGEWIHEPDAFVAVRARRGRPAGGLCVRHPQRTGRDLAAAGALRLHREPGACCPRRGAAGSAASCLRAVWDRVAALGGTEVRLGVIAANARRGRSTRRSASSRSS